MQARVIWEVLSRRVPMIAIGTFCTALLAYWAAAPLWLPYCVAIVIGVLALVIMARRNRRGSRMLAQEEQDAEESWIAHELAGKGSPAGFYLLIFFGLVTIVLTGLQGAYALPAWAGLALGVAWGIANAGHPTGERSEP